MSRYEGEGAVRRSPRVPAEEMSPISITNPLATPNRMTSRLGVDKNVFLDTFPVRSVSGSGVRAPTSRTRGERTTNASYTA